MYYANPTAYRKGMAPVGDAGYGVIVGWVPRKKRLAQCEKMQYWYEKYINATEKQKQLPSFLGMRAGKENRKYRRLRKKYERLGKAAWKKCKQTGRNVDATVMREEEGGLVEEAGGWGEEVTLTRDAPLVADLDSMTTYAPEDVAPTGPNWLLWGAAGGGGLLLLLLLRRKK